MSDEMPAGHEFMSAQSARAQAQRQQHRRRQPFQPTASPHLLRSDDGLIDPSEWDGAPVVQREWGVKDLIPMGCTTLLTGDGGQGKSHLAMQLMISAATGSLWCGRQVANVPTLGIFCEDDPAELQRRMADILNDEGHRFSQLKGYMTVVSRIGRDNLMFQAEDFGEAGTVTAFLHQVRITAHHLGARIVVLDSLYNFFGGNENNRPQTNQFINAISGIAADIDGAVVLLGHPSVTGISSGTGSSGSTAWHNAVRSRLYLHHRKLKAGEDADKYGNGPLVLKSMKSNYGARPAEIELERLGSRFIERGAPVSSGGERTVWSAAEPPQTAFDLREGS